jgi:glycerol-3-phosphate acyltransferase PlsY
MFGHARPVYLRFSKGGKMVATAGGVTFALAPLAAATCLALWIVAFGLVRYASVASIVTAAALPVFCFLYGAPGPVVGFAALAAVGVIALHHQNIRRLFAGTEPRFDRWRRGAAS